MQAIFHGKWPMNLARNLCIEEDDSWLQIKENAAFTTIIYWRWCALNPTWALNYKELA